MSAALESRLEESIADYGKMPTAQQLEKLDRILMVYTNGDAHATEGLKLTYISLVRQPMAVGIDEFDFLFFFFFLATCFP